MPRPKLSEKDKKVSVTVRLRPSTKNLIKKKSKTVTKGIESAINEYYDLEE